MKHILARYLCLLVMVLSGSIAMADDFTLKGKVIDEDGQALELVTVSCLAQGKVAMTNLKGEFSTLSKSGFRWWVTVRGSGCSDARRVR